MDYPRRYIDQLGFPFRMLGIHNIFCRFTGIQIPEKSGACPVLEGIQRRGGIGNRIFGPEALIRPALNQLAVFQILIGAVLPYHIICGGIFPFIEIAEIFTASHAHGNQIVPALEQVHGHFHRVPCCRVRIYAFFLFCHCGKIFFQLFDAVDFIHSVFFTKIAPDQHRHCIIHIRAVFGYHIAFAVNFCLLKCHAVLALRCLRHIFAQQIIGYFHKGALRGFFIVKGPG